MIISLYHDQLEACNSIGCWQKVLRGIADHYKLDHFFYGSIIQIQSGKDIHIMIDGYPPGWWKHYENHNYLNYDPVVLKIISSSLPFTWDSITDLTPIQKRIMEEATSYGIANGISCPVHTSTESASLSFAVSDKDNQNIKAYITDLFYIAHALHVSVIKAYRDTSKLLSPQQTKVLLLANQGLTYKQIALRMGITVDTVKYHSQELYKKLGAKNKPEALSKARTLGLLPVI